MKKEKFQGMVESHFSCIELGVSPLIAIINSEVDFHRFRKFSIELLLAVHLRYYAHAVQLFLKAVSGLFQILSLLHVLVAAYLLRLEFLVKLC